MEGGDRESMPACCQRYHWFFTRAENMAVIQISLPRMTKKAKLYTANTTFERFVMDLKDHLPCFSPQTRFFRFCSERLNSPDCVLSSITGSSPPASHIIMTCIESPELFYINLFLLGPSGASVAYLR